MCKRHSSDTGFLLMDWKCSRSGKASWKTALLGDWGTVTTLGCVEFPEGPTVLVGAGRLVVQSALNASNQSRSPLESWRHLNRLKTYHEPN